MACIAQLVNVLAPLMTETGGRCWKQTTWYPFEHASRYGRGELVYSVERGPMLDTPRYGEQPAVETIVTREPDSGMATLFAANRSVDTAVPMRAMLNGAHSLLLADAVRIHSDDPHAVNTADQPARVAPTPIADARIEGRRLEALLPPLSWNVFRLAPGA
jgi:alpha-N-arabinofuranosidase